MNEIITDLGNGNKIIKYNEINLPSVIESGDVNVSFQKALIEQTVQKILKGIGIENLGQGKLKDAFGRAGIFTIDSKEFGMLNFLGTKGGSSTKTFTPITDYSLLGTDVGDKVQAMGLNMEKLVEISGEKEWGIKTELLLLLGRKTFNNIKNLSNAELNILLTKFTPTLTNNVLEKIKGNNPEVITVDSNSELAIQISQMLNPGANVGAVEIVQSGKSLEATDAFVISDGNVYEPSIRDSDGKFTGKKVLELDPISQIGQISKGVQREINIGLYEVNKPLKKDAQDFKNAIISSMKDINNN